MWISDLAADPNFLRGAATTAAGLSSGLAFPVAGHDFVGVVEFFSRAPRERDVELLDVLESVASQVTGFVARVRAEEQARHARVLAEHESRVKDDLLGRISHELRNPLSAIQGWLDVLARRAMDDAARGRALRVARRNTALLRLLADDLVDAARIGRGGALAMSMERVDVAEIVRDVATESAAAAPSAVQVVVDVPSTDVRVVGDPLRLRQVFGNLIANALKFTARTVTVRLAMDADGVTVHVIDDGIGMPREHLARVFESYWQAGTRAGGLGLGLTIARHVVEAHGGQLGAASDGPGRGSTFTVRLPAARPAPVA
jgi:signal transduction histidine kinase